MIYSINPGLTADIKAFGGGTFNKCFNCGNCTAVCALSKGDTVFPRKTIRYLQLGLEDRLIESPEPWLCYYCGGCSDTCPREAYPGEIMMATRRWLTSRLDWTGISKKLYTSWKWEICILMIGALAVLGLFTIPGMFGAKFGFQTAHGAALEHVRLDIFARKGIMHYGDWALAALLTLFISINAFRMIFSLRRSEPGLHIPLSIWISKITVLFGHGATQRRWLECDNDQRWQWLQHLILFSGYIIMASMVEIFFPWFQRDTSEFHWTAILGYYATVVLLGTTSLALWGRLKKKTQIHRFSHRIDYSFLTLLILTTLSGIILHFFRRMDLPWPTYILYVGHLMIAVPLLITQVPFGKWPHLYFRPLALYMVAVHEAAKEREAKLAPEAQPAAA